MEQSSVMDKKNFTRGGPPPNKVSQDSTNKPEYVRKRYSQTSRKKDVESYSKAPSNLGRSGQRYVRSREKMGSQVNCQNYEVGSIQKTGSKKYKEITHQLVYPDYWQRMGNRRESGYQSYGKRNKIHVEFSKEHHRQSNCQYVVPVGNDYSMYENDPDQLVEWNLIEEVWFHCVDSPNCPICLYPPVAAKITNCGHIFCYSCILHYLALSDSAWRNCPLCPNSGECVQKDLLKSVVTVKCKDYNIGEQIEMLLMKRNKDSLVPAAVHSSVMPIASSYSNLKNTLTNFKLIVADVVEIKEHIIEREERELEFQKEREKDQPESCFIDEALNLLKARKEKLLNNSVLADKVGSLNISEGAMSLPLISDTMCDTECSPNETKNGAKQIFYFYQSKSGSHVYLNSLNVHMLTKEFGSIENCPQTIIGTIIQKDSMWMTSDFRDRFRYLRHIPLSCSLNFVELQLTDPVLSRETINEFKHRIEVNENKRNRKELEVKKIERKAKKAEDKMFGRSGPWIDVHLDSKTQFPDFSQEPSILSEENVGQETMVNEILKCEKWNDTSFAQITKNRNKDTASIPEPQWPSLSGQSSVVHTEHDSEVPSFKETFLKATFDCTPSSVAKGKKTKKKNLLLFSTGGQRN